MSPSAPVSLNLQAILKTAATRLGIGARARLVSGLPPAAQAFYVAVASRADLAVIVVPTDGAVEQMTSDVRFFLSGLEGLADDEVEQAALPFPSHEVDPYRGLAPHFDVASARARALHGLAAGTARVVVAAAAALLPRVSAPARLLEASRVLAPGMDVSPTDLADLMAEAGYTREDPVDQHGEFCLRGGVLDFFPASESRPIRLEFVGDTIESIRRYDPATQRSDMSLDRALVLPLKERFGEAPSDGATVVDFVAARAPMRWFVSEIEEVRARGIAAGQQIERSYAEATGRGREVPPPSSLAIEWAAVEPVLAGATKLEELAIDEPDSPDAARHVRCQPAVELRGRVGDWARDIRLSRDAGETVLFIAATAGRAERTIELLADYEIRAAPIERAEDTSAAPVLVATGRLSRGFRLIDAGLVVTAEADVFDEERRLVERRQSRTGTFLSDFRDLKVGDFVVHVDHGIGVFVGLRQLRVALEPQEFMELRYADEAKLFVPVERLDLVQKYSGGTRPSLDRLGGTSWERAKTRVRKAMRDMAEELLKLYAARKALSGHAFSHDSHWQREFEDAFEYELTPDQQSAIAEIKADMEAPFPMDRLLCGDVGYGKTEVAMRAAFKAVMDGKQVAFLAPTTVLALQHLKTLRSRFAAFPVRVDMISRFRTKAEQKQVLADLAAGRIEVVVGTHRLLSKDLQFRDLGLLVVDEEQRFGVAHKERLKQLRRRVDVLTMTATPIPRTLNMSLVGIRDMSVIETPPKDRLSIQTSVVKFDSQVIHRAIRNELERGGQVYFVHNRVESIYSVGNLVSKLVPEARLAVAHGQMSEAALERVMVDFVERKYDVLLATTIIENGLDIPNANTLVVNRADRYGLAQLYQLRGRVGRSDRRAYAYLLIPPEDSLSPVARKRLAAIREFSDLGSGFRIAALDLEIRGAGNLLGGEQSGHIDAIGFDMYMKLLEQTVRELKGEEAEDQLRSAVNLKVDLRIDETYIPDVNQRLAIYRRIAAARGELEIGTIVEEARDRYGAPPPSLLNLADYGRIRVLADRLRMESIDRQAQFIVFKFRPDTAVDPTRLLRLVHDRPDLTFVPPASLRLDLERAAALYTQPAARSHDGPRRRDRRGSGPVAGGSWWTARATAGVVTGGFSKAEITRPAQEDPRSSGGAFTLTVQLLEELRPLGH